MDYSIKSTPINRWWSILSRWNSPLVKELLILLLANGITMHPLHLLLSSHSAWQPHIKTIHWMTQRYLMLPMCTTYCSRMSSSQAFHRDYATNIGVCHIHTPSGRKNHLSYPHCSSYIFSTCGLLQWWTIAGFLHDKYNPLDSQLVICISPMSKNSIGKDHSLLTHKKILPLTIL